jgi:hypothetical protein
VDVLLLAYTVGIIASMVPLLPAGVGIVETVTPLILHAYGVPLPAALAAVLSFRLFASVLPAVAGALALVGLRVGVTAPVEGGVAERDLGRAVPRGHPTPSGCRSRRLATDLAPNAKRPIRSFRAEGGRG